MIDKKKSRKSARRQEKIQDRIYPLRLCVFT
jgi:hypothetical protein